MTPISKICVIGGAMAALALSTSSAWAPIYMNNTKVTVPKVTPPKVTPPSTAHPSDSASPKLLSKGASSGAGTGKANTLNSK
jgi:hypothetical protein